MTFLIISQGTYHFLQILAGILVVIIFLFLYFYLTENRNFDQIATAVVILVLYFIVGLASCNVTKRQIGSVCGDGFESSATGSGACSSHDGVSFKRYEVKYKKYDEPWGTIHKIFYFWYALNDDHEESEIVYDDEDDDEADPEIKYHLR